MIGPPKFVNKHEYVHPVEHVRYVHTNVARALQLPRGESVISTNVERKRAEALMWEEIFVTRLFLAHLAGEVGLALDSWADDLRYRWEYRDIRVSGLFFEGERDYSTVEYWLGEPGGPESDHDCSQVFELLPRAWHSTIINRGDLIGISLFDFWVGPASKHGVVFVKYEGGYRAVFLPMMSECRFGYGSDQRFPSARWRHQYHLEGTSEVWIEKQIEAWSQALHELTPSLIEDVLDTLPQYWKPSDWDQKVLDWFDGCDVDAAVDKMRDYSLLCNKPSEGALFKSPRVEQS